MPSILAGPLDLLDETECRRLLGTVDIGRLGFTAGALPAIVPVPFALHENCLFIPARASSGVAQAVRGAVVALEVDSYRDAGDPGWSVTVVGPSRLLADPGSVACIDRLHLFPRSSDADRCYITVQAGVIRGWRTPAALPRRRPTADGPGHRAAVAV